MGNTNLTEVLNRMKIERSELCGRVEKLEAFLNTEKYQTLDIDAAMLLNIQLNAMRTYLAVLDLRIISMSNS